MLQLSNLTTCNFLGSRFGCDCWRIGYIERHGTWYEWGLLFLLFFV